MHHSSADLVTLGTAVATQRKARHLSQGELAKTLRCSQTTISRLEQGQAITPEVLNLVTTFLGIELNDPPSDLAPDTSIPPHARLTLRSVRLAAGCSARDLSKRTGLSIATISRIERGLTDLTPATLCAVARALEVSPSVLIEPPTGPSNPARLPTIISTRYPDGLTIDIQINRPIDYPVWRRLQTLLEPLAPGRPAADPATAEPPNPAVDARPTPSTAPGPGSRLADRLRFARRLSHITIPALARATGISVPTIESIEAGTITSTPHTVKLARYLGVSPDWLDDGTGSFERASPR